MLPATMRAPGFLALCLCVTASLVFAGDADARKKRGKKRCKRGQRFVEGGTPAYGGPGLGFETIHTFGNDGCVRVFRSTEDGRFSLVVTGKERAGWVATGQVESSLSSDDDAKPTKLEEARDVVVVRDTPLRAKPRFDARAVTTLKQGTKLNVTEGSPDGLWFWVVQGGKKGWLSRYQTAGEMPAKGSTPSAGSGGWIVRPGDTEPTPPPVAAIEKAKAAADKPKEGDKPAEGDGAEGENVEGEGEGAKTAEGAEGEVAPATAKLIGRGHEISFAVTIGSWNQSYSSDAYEDPFYKYDLSSTGPAMQLAYAMRTDLPFLLDVRAGFGIFGFDLVLPGDNEPIYTPVIAADLGLAAGWRLYGDALVDVEAGVGSGLDIVWVSDLYDGNTLIDAFTPGFYIDALRPHVAARTRLGGGSLGLVTVEAGLPLGFYAMLYDPGGKYLDEFGNVPVVDQPRPPRLEEEPVDDGDVEPPIVHPSLGVEGRFTYGLPLGDVVRLELGGSLGVHQAFIGGPGVRAAGIYTAATNVDVVGGLHLGGAFSF
jgi:hypothetical protein